MNKDVIYIEPEDDITDIITKIEKAKEKIVALVPPKKAGVFRSLVNIKLIAKVGAGAKKSVVLVTADPSIVKLAATTKLPVAKNLQTAPVIPEAAEEEAVEAHTIEPVDDPEEGEDEYAEEGASENSAETEDDEDVVDDEKPAKEAEKKEKKPEEKKGIVGWIKSHKKLVIAGGVCAAGIIGFLIWAFGFAPAVDITVAIKTDSKNFSEGISFVNSLGEEDAKEGKFYLEQKKLEESTEVKFDATGEKNQGERASGKITVIATIDARNGGTVVINTGDVFTYKGLSYSADSSVTMRYDGKDDSVCSNADTSTKREFDKQGCRIYADINVTANGAGEKYNLSATSSGWSTTANIEVYSATAMSGGTDKIITVVQQSDVEAAKASLTSEKESEMKEKLFQTINQDEYLIIESSFDQTTPSATATPGVDEEVTEGTQPALKATTTASVYVINKDKLKEFIAEKANLEDGQKVYEVKDVYIENFVADNGVGSAKLKGQYFVGPKITETEVVEKVKGKGLGDAQREIRDLYGVSNVTIDKSYPWVMTVPSDSNKVTVKFEIKDQNGNEVKVRSEADETDSEDEDDNSDDTAQES